MSDFGLRSPKTVDSGLTGFIDGSAADIPIDLYEVERVSGLPIT